MALKYFPREMLNAFLIFTMRATFPAHFTSCELHTEINKHFIRFYFTLIILLGLINLIQSVESVQDVRLPITKFSPAAHYLLAFDQNVLHQ